MDNLTFFQNLSELYWGRDGFQTLFFLSLLLIVIFKGSRGEKTGLMWYSVCILLVVYNPITYYVCKFIFKYGGVIEYYCRLFCLIPVVFLIAYALVLLLKRSSGWKKFCGTLVVLFVVMVSGHNLYQEEWFVKAENVNKVPSDVMQLSALFQEYDGPIEIMAPTELLPYIRQVDSKFSLLYGRGDILTISEELRSEAPDVDMLLSHAKSTGTDYLIVPYREDILQQYIQLGCEVVGYTDRYVVLKQNYPAWVLKQYADDSGRQGMFYTLQNTTDGALFIVDGGNPENEEQVREVIREAGGVVTAWFLTHYHPDHIGAFNEIYKDPQDITINQIYATPYDEELFTETAQPWDAIEMLQEFVTETAGEDNVHYISRDFVFEYKDMTITFFNCFDEELIQMETGDILNNISLVFKAETAENSVLFCGDAHGNNLADWLIERYGEELRSDYVQLGHHGNRSFPERFYDAVQPEGVFFDAPEWLFVEPYDAKELADHFSEQGVECYEYTTAPNEIWLY